MYQRVELMAPEEIKYSTRCLLRLDFLGVSGETRAGWKQSRGRRCGGE